MQVGTENLTMKEALKGMKEQAARMAVEAQQAAAAAAAQREEADTALASVNSELEAERKRITSLQVSPGFFTSLPTQENCYQRATRHLQGGRQISWMPVLSLDIPGVHGPFKITQWRCVLIG